MSFFIKKVDPEKIEKLKSQIRQNKIVSRKVKFFSEEVRTIHQQIKEFLDKNSCKYYNKDVIYTVFLFRDSGIKGNAISRSKALKLLNYGRLADRKMIKGIKTTIYVNNEIAKKEFAKKYGVRKQNEIK